MSSKFKNFLPADPFLFKKSKIRKTSSQDQLISHKSHQTQPNTIVKLKNVFPSTTNTSTWPSRCAAGKKISSGQPHGTSLSSFWSRPKSATPFEIKSRLSYPFDAIFKQNLVDFLFKRKMHIICILIWTDITTPVVSLKKDQRILTFWV